MLTIICLSLVHLLPCTLPNMQVVCKLVAWAQMPGDMLSGRPLCGACCCINLVLHLKNSLWFLNEIFQHFYTSSILHNLLLCMRSFWIVFNSARFRYRIVSVTSVIICRDNIATSGTIEDQIQIDVYRIDFTSFSIKASVIKERAPVTVTWSCDSHVLPWQSRAMVHILYNVEAL